MPPPPTDEQTLLDITPARARIDGRRFFLTYSQVGDDFDESVLLVDLHLLGAHWIEAAEEFHQDDGRHYHAVVVFLRRFCRHMRAFDSQGKHPNIQSIKNGNIDLFNRRHYLRKGPNRPKEDCHTPEAHADGPCDYTAEPIHIGDVPPYVIPQPRKTYEEILESVDTQDAFLAEIKRSHARDFVLRHDAVLSYAQTYYNRPQTFVSRYEEADFFVPEPLNDWVQDVLREVGTPSPGSLFVEC